MSFDLIGNRNIYTSILNTKADIFNLLYMNILFKAKKIINYVPARCNSSAPCDDNGVQLAIIHSNSSQRKRAFANATAV